MFTQSIFWRNLLELILISQYESSTLNNLSIITISFTYPVTKKSCCGKTINVKQNVARRVKKSVSEINKNITDTGLITKNTVNYRRKTERENMK